MTAVRAPGLSAFVRTKNEEEYIVASLLSGYRFFDEIVVVLNNSTDSTCKIIQELQTSYPKIRLLNYDGHCSPVGPGYHERVISAPEKSLATYYNWCVNQTNYSHACKWDGDMIATPALERARDHLQSHDVIAFDGHDVLGQDTTSNEPRIFRVDVARARYVDWDLYEVLQHDYGRVISLEEKCYLHMKLVKRDWLHRSWVNPNLMATRSVPETGKKESTRDHIFRSLIRRFGRARRSAR